MGNDNKDKLYRNSAIGDLHENQNCFVNYNVNKYKIVSKARKDFHLKTLEADYIFSLMCKNYYKIVRIYFKVYLNAT